MRSLPSRVSRESCGSLPLPPHQGGPTGSISATVARLPPGPAGGRPAGIDHQQLHFPLDDHPLPIQRGADRARPARGVDGLDVEVVDALAVGQGDDQRDARRLAGQDLGPLAGPCLPPLGRRDELRLQPDLGVVGDGQEVRLDLHPHLFAGGEDQRVAGHADPQLVARRAADPQAVFAGIEGQIDKLAGKVAQGDGGDGDGRPAPRIVGGGQVDQEFCVRRGGHQHVDAVVVAGAALADGQAAVFQPHRPRLIGLDAQGTGFGERAPAHGDGALPPPLGAAPQAMRIRIVVVAVAGASSLGGASPWAARWLGRPPCHQRNRQGPAGRREAVCGGVLAP